MTSISDLPGTRGVAERERSVTRVVVFDFDGTLVDSNIIKREAFFDAVRGYAGASRFIGCILDEHSGATRSQVFATLGRRVHPRDPRAAARMAAELVERYGVVTETRVARCPEIPGAEATMDELVRRGYVLALNSSTPTDALAEIIRRRGWSGRFGKVLGAPPDKGANLRRIADEIGVSRRDIVMVGDREADRQGAIEAGCRFVGLLRPDSDFAAPVPPHVTNLAALTSLLEQWEASFSDCESQETSSRVTPR